MGKILSQSFLLRACFVTHSLHIHKGSTRATPSQRQHQEYPSSTYEEGNKWYQSNRENQCLLINPKTLVK